MAKLMFKENTDALAIDASEEHEQEPAVPRGRSTIGPIWQQDTVEQEMREVQCENPNVISASTRDQSHR